jgi:hypothetical protein
LTILGIDQLPGPRTASLRANPGKRAASLSIK